MSFRLAASVFIALLAFSSGTVATRQVEATASQTWLDDSELEHRIVDAMQPTDAIVPRPTAPKLAEKLLWRLLDARYGCFVSNASGRASIGWTLNADMAEMIGGPPTSPRYKDGPDLAENRFALVHGTKPRSGGEQSLTIYDLKGKRLHVALFHGFPWRPDEPEPDTTDRTTHLSVFLSPTTPTRDYPTLNRFVRAWHDDLKEHTGYSSMIMEKSQIDCGR